ncbi:hypothetical protein FPRO05_10587 [Fusarium proliferatum]|uniref:Zn(2)-C6 fungal-type domain-containing protein n=1 Tax=Gibberella intermedia TaxID=948311 RepID=A0A365NC70_GIBIN|nr:hypothetical protein FPRO05_10587 [Fusarium proliferatum]
MRVCKGPSVRCNREIPTCGKCADLGTDCVYPERQGARATDDTLNAILRRLERIEKSAGSPSTTSPQSGTPASLETTHLQSGTQSSRLSPFAISRDNAASDASHRHSTTRNVLATSPHLPERGPHAVLQEPLRRVQDLNLQALSVETVTATIDVPPELAKTWIQRYFEVMPTDIFLSLVDRRVIELLPDMIGLPHIRLDPAILVVYYYILHSPNYPSGFGQDNIDEVRRGFWELMYYEFFHRLVYDDPPTMTAQMKQWIVSLPWLESCKRPVSQEVPTIRFILKSRLTFILAEFFMLLGNISGRFEGELFAQVLALCQQIDDLYKDWDIDTWKTSSKENKLHSWMLADLTIAGYTCIVFMLHRASLTTAELPQEISQLPIALSASRQVLKAGNELLKQCPYAVTLYYLFGTYQVDAVYACLVSSLMRLPESHTARADLRLLEDFTRDFSNLVVEDESFRPLLTALRTLNSSVYAKLD